MSVWTPSTRARSAFDKVTLSVHYSLSLETDCLAAVKFISSASAPESHTEKCKRTWQGTAGRRTICKEDICRIGRWFWKACLGAILEHSEVAVASCSDSTLTRISKYGHNYHLLCPTSWYPTWRGPVPCHHSHQSSSSFWLSGSCTMVNLLKILCVGLRSRGLFLTHVSRSIGVTLVQV